MVVSMMVVVVKMVVVMVTRGRAKNRQDKICFVSNNENGCLVQILTALDQLVSYHLKILECHWGGQVEKEEVSIRRSDGSPLQISPFQEGR